MLNLLRKPDRSRPINPRFRAYGKARIDIAQRAATREDWNRLWKKSTFSFPFSWGGNWKQCVEYKVADFPAEVGFFIDILGFPVNAFDPDYAMFTSPAGEFFFSVVPVLEGEQPTSPDSIRLQFMVERIMETTRELDSRGVIFEQWPEQADEGSSLVIASFRSPHGIGIELWGFSGEETGEEIAEGPAADQATSGAHFKSHHSSYENDPDLSDSQDDLESQYEEDEDYELEANGDESIDFDYVPEE
jgi:catechol 2,3-dioxygenase-like lactoylglutathione lyase family enzyme